MKTKDINKEKELDDDVKNTESTDNSANKAEDKSDKKKEVKEKKTTKKKSKRKKTKEAELEEELIETKEKLAEINDKYLRLYSEFDNFRKRTIKEKSDIYKTAGEDVIISIISVVDDFERALKATTEATEDNKAHREGLELIYNRFLNILSQKNVKEIECIGKDFDTDLHEAFTKMPAPTEEMKAKVLDVIEKGYTMNDKVIRFAKVVVGD
jgi:molecular chaperone GrpE